MYVMFKDLSKLLASPSRLRLIKFFALQPTLRYESADVASAIGISKRSADIELKKLVKTKLLVRKSQGKKVFYSYAEAHPHGEALKVFLEETTLPNDKTITGAFRGVSGTSLVIVTGILVRDSRSPLDLLIVTRRPKHPSIGRAVRRIETLAAIPLRYAVLETGEYKSRLVANDRLLRDVFDYSHKAVIGRV